MSIKQALPLPTSPLVDPDTGIITREWLNVFTTLLMRTGGTSGAVGTLDEVASNVMLGLLADPVDAPAINGGAVTTEVLALLADPPDAPMPGPAGPPGASADTLVAILLADVPDAFF